MIYNDIIFGKVKIDEPIILDLIKSRSLQRLKSIDQGGYEPLYVHRTVLKNNIFHNRFAHSLGVYLLLRKFNASLEEQIAGLVHDVSHASFSHGIDYVLGDEKSQKEQSHQDSVFDSYVRQTEIPKILIKYKFNLEYILNDKNFPLKEKGLPNLCADRIEYCLREALVFGKIKKIGVKIILENLNVFDNQWVFNNFTVAKRFAGLFFKMNKVYYSGLSTAIMFKTIGDCLKYAFEQGYVNARDFYTTDAAVLKKIRKNFKKDKRLKVLFNRMNGKNKCRNDPKNYEARIFCKSRIVDPLCWHKGKIVKVSDVDKNWAKVVKNELKPKEYFLKFSE